LPKIKIDAYLYDRIRRVAEIAGYTSPDEFIIHMIEKELDKLEPDEADEKKIEERLRGLGYIE